MYRLSVAKFALRDYHAPLVFLHSGWGRTFRLYYYLWLIWGRGHAILVDTGFYKDEAQKMLPGFEQEPEEEPLKLLQRKGVCPGEVDTIILTHGHFDHMSGLLSDYRNARVIMHRREFECTARPPHPWWSLYTSKPAVAWLDSLGERLTLVDEDGEVMPGVEVVWTGGHTPGSQAVRVDIGGRKALMTGDVLISYRNLEKDIPVGINTCVQECLDAMARIRACEQAGDLVLPSHDPLVLERTGRGTATPVGEWVDVVNT